MTDQSRQPIMLEQLTVGMFVVELDIPWINSPFITHARRIRSFKDIEALRRSGVKKLVIDISRGQAPKVLAPEPDPLENPIKPEPAKATVEEERSLADELGAAKAIKNQVKRLAQQLNAALEMKRPIDITPITPLIDDTLASLGRNNQALLNLVHVSRKSQKLAEHAFSTFCLSLSLGSMCDFNDDELEALGVAALLHEAGWVQLPLNLMGKRTAYSVKEQQLVHQHVEIGLKLLGSSVLPELAVTIIKEHHERLDGSGYPEGSRSMRLISQVLAIVDSYDERVHQLCDKPGALPRLVLQGLFHDARKGVFDEALVARFISLMGVYPVSSAVLLKSGERGIVIENAAKEGKTVVHLFYGENSQPLREPELVVIPDPERPDREISRLLDPKCTQDDPYGHLVLHA